jgi:hypothetical protein
MVIAQDASRGWAAVALPPATRRFKNRERTPCLFPLISMMMAAKRKQIVKQIMRKLTSFTNRRRFLWTGLTAFVSGMLGRNAAAQAAKATPRLQQSGEPLTSHARLGNPPSQPLDTMVLFERGDNNNDKAMTHQVLSLIHQEKGKKSYPWTLYASLETEHETGDACVVCSRLHKNGPGWSSGLHSEVFNHGRMVALGVNVEMSNDYSGADPTQVIGVNIQAVGGLRPMQYGVQIHDGQGHFETGIGLNGKSEKGIDMNGKYDVGLDMHANPIRLNEGACVILDGKGQIRVRYRDGSIEFLNGDRCFGHLDVNGVDHAL